MTLTLHLADSKSRRNDPHLSAELRLTYGDPTRRYCVGDIRRSYRKLRKLGIDAYEARGFVWYLLFDAHLARDTEYWIKDYA